MRRTTGILRTLLLALAFMLCCIAVHAQTTTNPTTLGTNSPKDTTHAKSNTNKWKDEDARITFEHLNSEKTYIPDTSLHQFQRRPFLHTWERDLGNPGSPANNLSFTPEYRVGPSLGYHVFDAYRFNIDSLSYYNTNRPYSIFTYQLGSKLEQVAGIMHSQNIKPNWNFMVDYRKTSMPGFYKTNRNNHDNFAFTTNYKSLDKHYVLYAAMVYNKEQHDENGGIVNDSELQDLSYIDRRTVDVAYQNSQYSLTRSTVTNMQRDFSILLQHSYTWGHSDTTYNADSTGYTYKLVPRFSITHKFELSTEKHLFKDLAPDSVRYVTLFTAQFANSGSGYYVAGGDSVVTQQNWFWVDNKVQLNGFIGKENNQLKFSAGLGNRFDQFRSQPAYNSNSATNNIISNYGVGEIKKEALKPGQWEYGGKTILYLTGDQAGDFALQTALGKDFKGKGSFVAGFEQQLSSAPYSYTTYLNKYAGLTYSFNKESVTTLYASIDARPLRLSAGVKNYIINNFIYINEAEVPAQYSVPFNLTQAWVRKVFKAGNFFLDNELIYQQTADNAPVNVPQLMGRHQLSYERDIFQHALKIATGAEIRYNTSYHPAGYDALLNKFFYQNSSYINNVPELSVFLNFRIKHFRAFIQADQLQQLFANNAINFVGTPVLNFYSTGSVNTPVYAAQNFMIRFGFSWVLVN